MKPWPCVTAVTLLTCVSILERRDDFDPLKPNDDRIHRDKVPTKQQEQHQKQRREYLQQKTQELEVAGTVAQRTQVVKLEHESRYGGYYGGWLPHARNDGELNNFTLKPKRTIATGSLDATEPTQSTIPSALCPVAMMATMNRKNLSARA